MREYFFPIVDFDAQLTLLGSAQAFHWRAADGGYVSVSGGVPMRVTEADGGLLVEAPESCGEEFLRRYFDLDRDYGLVAREFSGFPCAEEAFSLLPGLRILRQPPWEALVAFLLSQNNNTRRIASLVQKVCEAFGEPVDAFGRRLFQFPTPAALAAAGAEALRRLGCGYRAEYLRDAARLVSDGFALDELSGMPYEDARAALQTLPGVGPKVADCVLLFGCGHLSAYPVDVWVYRLSRAWLSLDTASNAEIARLARARFGPHAGILQQYLFHCARCGLMDM